MRANGASMTARGFPRRDPRARTRIGHPTFDGKFDSPLSPVDPSPGNRLRGGQDAEAPGQSAEMPAQSSQHASQHAAQPNEGFSLGGPLGQSEGEVYETHHPRLSGRFAMKLLKGAADASAEAIDHFRGDLEKIAALRHPNIVEVLEVGALPDGTPVMVMERLDGQTLSERLARRTAMPLSEVLPIVRGIATGLEAAHRVGVIHREIRPDNVFLAEIAGYEQGFVKLLDFGVAHLFWQGSLTRLDSHSMTAESARYLSPEQAEGRLHDVDARADQFALAAIAYRLLSGQDPFPGSDLGAVLERVKTAKPLPLAGLIACDARVDGVLAKALARDRGDRFESVLGFAKSLEAAAEAPVVRPTPVHTSRNARLMNEPTMPAVAPMPQASQPGPQDVTRKSTSRSIIRQGDGTEARMQGRSGVVDPTLSGTRRDSVSARFFEEGEHKERGHWEAADLAEPDVDPEAADFDSFDHVPRRRSRFIPVLVIGALVAVGVALYVGWRPSFSPTAEQARPEDSTGSTATGSELADPASGVAPVPPTPVAAQPEASEPVPPTPAASGSPAAAAPAGPSAKSTAAPPTTAAEAPAAPPAVPPSAAPSAAAPTPLPSTPSPSAAPAPVAAPAAPAAPASGKPQVQIFESEAAARAAMREPAAAPASRPAAAPAPTAAPERRRAAPRAEDPLRGYVWSPKEQRLVPAETPRP